MRSDLRRHRGLGLAAFAALAIGGLAACGGTAGPAPGPAPSGATAPQAGSATVFPVTSSRLYYLTKLTGAQLCGLLHPGEPAQIAGAPTGPATFTATPGVSISCRWIASTDDFNVTISKIETWQETRATDLLVTNPTRITIDGHPAIGFGLHLDVAAAGPDDPAISFESRTLAEAIRLARIVMPRLLAINGAS